MSAIKPSKPIDAPADIMAAARANLALRARARGNVNAAAAYEAGEGEGWGLRHEVDKLLAERGRADGLPAQ